MAAIAVQPIILNDVTLTVGTDNYEASVSQVQFDPASTVVRWKGMTPTSVYAFSTTSEWTVTLSYAQDWATVNSLSAYLLANEGKSVIMKFKPKKAATGTSPTVTATVLITAGSIGGSIDGVATATVTLGVSGKPAVAAE
ncbi:MULTISPECIES: hypothetical protein [unclassified Microbacterium]|uniref:hypothetical protein n=1 Tax=unclassified Microbacterium TaxID=2609290 RepID=UPI00214B0706|nr:MULTISPECIES: hypothetical protein [unclassified Microbacterium]MCR2785436.1 hypothetical protein [Microbacterium sp. zg.B96]WIM14537.1 hypothetical protein QNO11_08080 [Microbacterium sp. zg-B96]